MPKLIFGTQKLISKSQKLISKVPKLISKRPKLISAGFHLSGLDWISHKKKPEIFTFAEIFLLCIVWVNKGLTSLPQPRACGLKLMGPELRLISVGP